MTEAEQNYYNAVNDFHKAVNRVLDNDIKIRQDAALKARQVVEMINAGEQIDEPDGGQYD